MSRDLTRIVEAIAFLIEASGDGGITIRRAHESELGDHFVVTCNVPSLESHLRTDLGESLPDAVERALRSWHKRVDDEARRSGAILAAIAD